MFISAKVIAVPIELLVRRSAIRSLIVSILISAIYQIALSRNKEFTAYLIDSFATRHNLIDWNKEGVYSLVGYLSIYFGSDAVCYRIKEIFSQK
jgi:hypothetical protein